MKVTRFAVLGTLGLGTALLAGGSAFAQARPAPEMVAVAPGYVAVMVPEAAPSPVVPGPLALQLEAMLSAPWPLGIEKPVIAAWPAAGLMQAELSGVKPVPGPVAAEVVTSISNGAEHCTQQLVYSSSNGSAKPKVIDFGNACHALAADFPNAGQMKVHAVQPNTVRPAYNTPA